MSYRPFGEINSEYVGKLVRSTTAGSSYVRFRDTGRVIYVDADGDLWVRWDNPLVPHTEEMDAWCILRDFVEIIE